MKEIWKDIKGYEGLYKVSNKGRVKSLKRKVKYRNSFKSIPEKIKKERFDKDGYCVIQLHNDGKRKKISIHRLVGLAFIKNKNNYDQINHKDFNKKNNNIKNLEWVNCSLNMQHDWKNNRRENSRKKSSERFKKLAKINIGSKHSQAKLTEKQVLEIRNKQGKYSHSEIAKLYNVCRVTITNILSRKVWKHI